MLAAMVIATVGQRAEGVLRVSLPLGVALSSGATVTIDHDWPMTGAYSTCLSSGCIADFEAGPELIDRLKQGNSLEVKAITDTGKQISLSLPLVGFDKAYDGPPLGEKSR